MERGTIDKNFYVLKLPPLAQDRKEKDRKTKLPSFVSMGLNKNFEELRFCRQCLKDFMVKIRQQLTFSPEVFSRALRNEISENYKGGLDKVKNKTSKSDHERYIQQVEDSAHSLEISGSPSAELENENENENGLNKQEKTVNIHINNKGNSKPNHTKLQTDEEKEQQCFWQACTEKFATIEGLLMHLYRLHVSEGTNVISDSGGSGTLELISKIVSGIGDVQVMDVEEDRDIEKTDTKKMQCKWTRCSESKNSTLSLIKHVLNEHVEHETYSCCWEHCNQEYLTRDLLTTHISNAHIGSGLKEYICKWENCTRQGKSFTQRQRAVRHIQMHTGYKPYVCESCDKRFLELHIKDQHVRTHTGERPYICDVTSCQKRFTSSGALKIHKRTHTGERPYACKYPSCRKSFAESSNLAKHSRTHSGEKPFPCKQTDCSKAFSRSDQLSRHLKVHSIENALCGTEGPKKRFRAGD
ncbi:Zinc-responsive transcriptional regulator ZAP1 [Zancudomyces culisetae]|uniref:Zinc-responsive transcriptional regulator ZAP1 n=1 Tax=Zancudomyces culisetae TaxID=1213189 RepID=A0A1R1PIU4_ZANCU|nr:Zinc-responsive transcriptional regulator ZAP1 [Zancudomyces culisetae]|eukprot:OMH80935.1 Zinc-responsive transcriptional regulator ZAP1 [Zancudomyces culisetae]